LIAASQYGSVMVEGLALLAAWSVFLAMLGLLAFFLFRRDE
jgi:hypothetical protein